MIKINFKDKKTILILLVIFWVILIIILSILGIYNNSKNKYGDSLEIINLNSYINGKPQDKNTLDFIKHNLLETIQYNVNYKINNNSIKDISVRDGSFLQKYDQQLDVNSVNFIVDIASIKQSYSVSYQWSKDNNNQNIIENENITLVSCLSVDNLIYGDFNCKDKNSTEKSNSNLIIQYLPYSTTNYIITADTINGKIILNIAIILNSNEPNNKIAVDSYKQDAINWIKSKNINPDDYSINYIISH